MRLKDFASKNLSRVSRAIGKFSSFAGASFKRVARALNPVTLGVGAFVAAWGALRGGLTVVEILASVDALDKMGDSLGTEVGRLEKLRGAFEIAGVGGDKFNAIMTGLGRSVGAVLDRNDQRLLRGFEQLGVSLDDLRSKDVVGIFEQMASGLEQYNTAQEKAAALSRFFPDNFQKIFALVGKGREEFRKLVDLASLFVGTISEGGAKAASRLNDAIGLLKTAVQSLGRDAVIRLAEKFADTIERIALFIAQNRETLSTAIAVIIESVARLLRIIAAAVLRIAALLRTGIDPLLDGLREIPLIGKAIADALGKAFDVPQLSDKAKAIRQDAVAVAQEIKRLESEVRRIQGFSGENDPSGGRVDRLQEQIRNAKNELAKLSASFKDEAPNGGDLFSGAVDAAALRELADLISTGDLPGGLTDALRDVFTQVKTGAGDVDELRQGFGDFFTGFGNQLTEVKKRWMDFAQAGRDAAATIVDGALSGLADTFADIITHTNSAKEAFKEYARQMLRDLARIIARLLIMRAVSSIFGGSGGTGAATSSGVAASASSGIASGAGSAIGSGAAGSAASSVILAPANGGGTTVNFNINAVDGQSVKRMLIDEAGTITSIVQSAAGGGNVPFRQAMARATV